MLIYTQNHLGALPFHFPGVPDEISSQLDQAIVTPAERIAQYSLIGAFAGVGLAAVAAFGFDLGKSKLGTLGLLLVPAIGAAIGVTAAVKGRQS